jgi:hypothetical protein
MDFEYFKETAKKMEVKILKARKPDGTSSVLSGFSSGIYPLPDPNFLKKLIAKERADLLEKELDKKEAGTVENKVKI